MILHDWGVLDYKIAYEKMQDVHAQALKDGQNHLILCQHEEIYTLGQDEDTSFDVKTFKTDRGGSITSHSPGQNIYYFCFQTPFPARFFSHVISVFTRFFESHLPLVYYDKKQPGFYLKDAKLLSLGFRYKKGVSLHGIALNVSPDLNFHNQINPCNLKDIRTSSLANEGVTFSCAEVNEKIIKLICEVFDESL
ncbi:Octanoate-[acyl-carrier-protein]-protein-N-octanoyltransferase [hydrothermal vent metagenome]|uniref:lipoyl(octanoyl) transferase n=1 Tax=hydrothermal vent metagenome TaxID=652676 RepID=A0A1W1BEJ0_9ZZZZ